VRHRASGFDVEDLGRAVATSGNITAVKTEAHAADNTLVGQVMNQIDVEDAPCPWVEDGVPVVAFPLVLRGQLLDIQISQDIALSQRHLVVRDQGILLVVGRRGWSRHLGRSREGSRVVLLRRGRASRRAARRAWALAARRGSWLRWLRVA
jgi:hypothetical protein